MGETTEFRSMDSPLLRIRQNGKGGGEENIYNGSQKQRITFEGQRGLKGASDETSVLTELLLISHPPALSSKLSTLLSGQDLLAEFLSNNIESFHENKIHKPCFRKMPLIHDREKRNSKCKCVQWFHNFRRRNCHLMH